MDVRAWVGERLQTLPEERFRVAPHRVPSRSAEKTIAFESFSVPLATGVGDALLAVPKSRSRTRDALVIMLHGLGDDCTVPFTQWQETLAAKGFASLSVTWDGHGPTGHSALDFAAATRSLPLILERLYGTGKQHEGWKPRSGPQCFLAGYSMGATLALIAATRPDVARVVNGVIAVSPIVALKLSRQTPADLFASYRPEVVLNDRLPRVAHDGVAAAFEPARTSFLGPFADSVRFHVGIEPSAQIRNFVEETFVQRRILQSIHVPVLWMHGVRDRVVPVRAAAPLFREIPAALFTHMDRLRGHRLMVLSQETREYVLSFLTAISRL